MNGQEFIKLEECRVCGSRDLYKYLDLGSLPLANRFVSTPYEAEPRFPLEVQYCGNCSLSQLSIVVNPVILFSHYRYRSSVSRAFQQHCSEMADEILSYYPDAKNSLVVDIASNDGCLLKECQKKGFRVLGVDPAKNLVDIANASGTPTICDFWGGKSAEEIIRRGKARVITATNVFAHVHDVKGFVKNASTALADDGLVIFEFHYGRELLDKTAFDTIYHEHLSYFLLKPVKMLFEKHGLSVFDAKIMPMHGGALRVYGVKTGRLAPRPSVEKFLEDENTAGLYSLETYNEFAKRVEKIRKDFMGFLQKKKKTGKIVAGFGAAAKGNTLLNYCGVNNKLMSFIVDETPEKQGLFYAGTGIPIVGIEEIEKRKPDFIVILPWNFAAEIIGKVDNIKGFKDNNGKYVIPTPQVRILNSITDL